MFRSNRNKVGIGIAAVLLGAGLSLTGAAVAADATSSSAIPAAAAPCCGQAWLYTFYSDASHTTVVGQVGPCQDENWGTVTQYSTKQLVSDNCGFAAA